MTDDRRRSEKGSSLLLTLARSRRGNKSWEDRKLGDWEADELNGGFRGIPSRVAPGVLQQP